LAALDGPCLKIIHERWSSFDPLARRRAVEFFMRYAGAHAPARRMLRIAAEDANPATAQAGFMALRSLGALAADELAALASHAPPSGVSPIGDRAASALVTLDPAHALAPLVAAYVKSSRAPRPALASAVRDARIAGGDATSDEAFVGSLGAVSTAAGARLVRALAERAETRTEARLLFAALIARADASTFEHAYLLAVAAAGIATEAEVRPWLVEVARAGDPWMLRAAAFASLATSTDVALVRSALADPAPRVRAGALRTLAAVDTGIEPDVLRAIDTPWSFVAVAAIDALGRTPALSAAAATALVAQAKNPSPAVVAAVFRAATPHGEVNLRRDADAALRSAWDEDVARAAIHYATARCDRALVDALVARYDRSEDPRRRDRDDELAEAAIDALGQLRTPEAVAKLRAIQAKAPATWAQDAAKRALEGAGRCGSAHGS
ncbi:MAG: hypothetical protein KC417_16945, partial [Myxococcales bacterium]|nr:hypothetical protein [Myxococcales bacterium]